MPLHIRFALYGLALGFSVSRMGYSEYSEVHKMFVFEDLRLFLTFVAGACLSALGYFAIRRLRNLPRKNFHWGSVVGGVLFGTGWAMTGGCPAVVLIQIGEGQVIAFLTLCGVMIGTWSFTKLKHRLPWNQGSCGA